MTNPIISADKTPWYQWDTGLTVSVSASGGAMNECHFANRKQGTAYVQAVIDGVARVPDELLQVAAPIKVYGYVSDVAGGQTYIEQTFEVIARNIPSGYTYTKTIQKTIRDVEKARDEAVQAAKDAAASVGAINVIAPKSVPNPASVQSDKAENLAIGSGAKAEANLTVAVGPHAVATHNGSVALGLGSEDSKDYEFSVGTPANASSGEVTREITHVSAPTNNTSASNKKYTDDNDAKTLAEAKKYTDDNTTNALIGKVSGKLLHVEDAWPSPLLSVTIDGAYKQDGTPSPENPVPIVSLTSAELNVCGKNLINVSEDALTEKYSNGAYTIEDGAITFNTANSWAGDYCYFNKIAVDERRLTFLLKWTGDVTISSQNGAKLLLRLYDSAGNMITLPIESVFDYNRGRFDVFNNHYKGYPSSPLKNSLSFSFLKSAGVAHAVLGVCFGASTAGIPVKIFDVQLEVGTAATPYTPCVSTTTSFTLPAEHPYLAALPGGIHDEIMIDKDGNASLVARTQKVDVSNLPEPSDVTPLNNGMSRYQYRSVIHTPAQNDTSAFAPAFPSVIDYSFPRQGMYVSNTAILLGATADPTDALKTGGYIYTSLATPITYPLGKLTIPSLPETISNVWTDAELTTNMSMTYKQDINAVIAGLSTQIAALKGTVNESPEVTNPTIE